MQNPQDDYAKKLYELEKQRQTNLGRAYRETNQIFKKIGLAAAVFVVGSGISGGLATISPVLFFLGMVAVIAAIVAIFKS